MSGFKVEQGLCKVVYFSGGHPVYESRIDIANLVSFTAEISVWFNFVQQNSDLIFLLPERWCMERIDQ